MWSANPMWSETLLLLAAIAAIGCGVLLGPLVLTVRAILRVCFSPSQLRRWQFPVAIGVGTGLVGATAVSGVLLGAQAAVTAAVLGLLALLAVLDQAWRWLPFAWTIPILALGTVTAWASDGILPAIIGLVAGAGTLLALQTGFRVWRGITALGTGDIWLAAGLGTLVGMPQIMWILGIAAVTGLAAEALAGLRRKGTTAQRMGVAYGTHLCVAYVIVLIF